MNPAGLTDAVEEAYRVGRPDLAERHCRDAIAVSGPGPEVLALLAEALLAQQKTAEAMECAGQAAAADPECHAAHILMAKALLRAGEDDRAEEWLRRTLEIDPGDSEGHCLLGYRLQAKGESEEGRAHLERSLAIRSLQGAAFWGLVRSRKTASEQDPLLVEIRSVSARPELSISERANLQFALGKSYEDLGDCERAIAFYDAANILSMSLWPANRAFRPERLSTAVDQTIRCFSKENLERWQSLGCEDARPIFIVGMIRSGTTLLEQILSSHPQIAAGGEIHFWVERAGSLFTGGPHRALDPRRAAAAQAEYSALVDLLAGSKSHVTDKLPQNFQVLGLIRALYPGAKTLHISRDAADNCMSIYATPYRVPPEYAHSKPNIARTYREYERLMMHWRAVLPEGSFLDVRYEDLATETEAVVRSILGHLGLPWSEACLKPQDNGRTVNTPSMFQVRQPVYSSSIGRSLKFSPWIREFLTPGRA